MSSDRVAAPSAILKQGGTASGIGESIEGGASAPPACRELKIAALYARVSTEKQEKEETIASQLDALRRAADERGYEIPPEYVFVDDGYTGARMDRPGLDRLRDLVAEGAFEAVLVYCPDRLARQYAYQVVVVDELKRGGCEVVFLNHDFGKTPEERMLLQIQGVFAEYERALITERMRRGKLFAARQGRVNWGVAPYGYRYIRKTDTTPQKLVLEETEAEVVRQMYRWLVEEQISSWAIGKRLNERSVPTRKGGWSGWRQSSVVEILRKPIYKGEAYYNTRQRMDVSHPYKERGFKDLRPGNLRGRGPRPREEWIPVRTPAIVDAETWDLAQAQLARNRELATRNNTKHQYLLRGLLICARCGRRMLGAWQGAGGRYRCALRCHPNAAKPCDGRDVRVPEIEPLVWEHVCKLLSDPELLKTQYQQGQGDPAVEVREEQERQRIQRKVQGLEREQRRLVDAYQAGVIELQELTERRVRIENYAHALKERLREIRDQRADREKELRMLEGLGEFCASVAHAMEEPSFEVKQKVLRLVVDRIVIEESRVVIEHVIPAGPVTLRTDPSLGQAFEAVEDFVGLLVDPRDAQRQRGEGGGGRRPRPAQGLKRGPEVADRDGQDERRHGRSSSVVSCQRG